MYFSTWADMIKIDNEQFLCQIGEDFYLIDAELVDIKKTKTYLYTKISQSEYESYIHEL